MIKRYYEFMRFMLRKGMVINMKKRLFGILLSTALVVSLLTVFAPEARAVTYGPYTVGNMTWKVETPSTTGASIGTLTIGARTGYTAAIPNYSASSRPPWYAHSAQVDQVIIENGVTEIGNSAFADFTNLTQVIVRGTVTRIGNDAFRGCGKLVEFLNDINGEFSGLTTIGTGAFYNCYSLETLYIPAVTSIGTNAFIGCSALYDINAGTTGRVRMYEGVVMEMNAAGTVPVRVIKCPVNITGNPTSSYIPNEYRIPAGVVSIDAEAFAYCVMIARVVIPAGVTTIGDRAFAYNSGLVMATFEGDAPTSFGTNVFYGTDDAFKIFFYPNGLRWTAPRWQGYPSEVNNSRLELDKYVIVMEMGTAASIRATVLPNTSRQAVIWSSGDETIAKVEGSSGLNDSIGIVTTADMPGTTTITVKALDNTAVAYCTVIVLERNPSATVVLLDYARIQARIGDETAPALTAVVYPFPDEKDPDFDAKKNEIARNLVWTSSNPAVAVVNADDPETFTRGIILRSAGTTTITVRTPDGRSSASCVVTVEAASVFVPVTDIALSTMTAAMGAMVDLNEISTVRPANATNSTKLWKIIPEQTTITDLRLDITGGVLTVPWSQTGKIAVEVEVPRGRADMDWGYGETNLSFTKTFIINVVAYIPVTGITDVPTLAFAGVPLRLQGTVQPAGASYRSITWSLDPDPQPDVYLDAATDTVLSRTPGTIKVKATVEGGYMSSTSAAAGNYEQTFIIKVDPYITNALDLRANPGGTVSGAGAGQFAGGEVVTITATPGAGYAFSGWYSTNGGTFADPSRAATQFTMPGNATMVTANFTYIGTPGGSASSGWSAGVMLPTPVHYFINNSVYIKNSQVTFGHVTVRDFQLFSYVTLDGKTLSRNAHYTANRAGGYTEIILANGYLNALEQGAHTLGVYFTDYVSVTAVFTVLSAAQTTQEYDDVYSSDWYAASVAYVSERGWMTARPSEPRRFRPSDPVTQGEVIDALYRMAGSPAIMNMYGQVLQGRDAAYEWVLANGVLPLGGSFELNSPIARQDIAVIFAKLVSVLRMSYPVVRAAPSFADEWQIDPNARSAVTAIYRAGVMGGRTVNTFVPLGNTTRAEYAAILHRFSEAMGRW